MQSLRVLLTTILTVSTVALLPSTSVAQAEKRADLTGKWLFSVNTDGGTGTPTVTLKQQGDSLTGHYSSQLLGEVDLKGSVKDQKCSLTSRTEVQGTALTVTYSGTVQRKDSLKGTVDLGGMATGTFTAKRQ